MNETAFHEFLEMEESEDLYLESNSENLTKEYPHSVMVAGILGCGAIASIITNSAAKGELNADLRFFHDVDMESAENLASQVDGIAVEDVNDMVDNVDLVIEAASQDAVVKVVPQILKMGKDVIIMSMGALIDLNFRNYLGRIAEENNSRIYAPSGAVVGLDGIKAASIGEINEVSLVTRKSPESLGISVDTETVLYEGKAGDAVRKFPANINVAAALSIAYGREVDVKIIADPNVSRNCHEVCVAGDFGEFRTITENETCTTNPKTSVLAAYSVVKLIKSLNNNLNVGI
jgi:aspartate dehydrogenase